MNRITAKAAALMAGVPTPMVLAAARRGELPAFDPTGYLDGPRRQGRPPSSFSFDPRDVKAWIHRHTINAHLSPAVRAAMGRVD